MGGSSRVGLSISIAAPSYPICQFVVLVTPLRALCHVFGRRAFGKSILKAYGVMGM